MHSGVRMCLTASDTPRTYCIAVETFSFLFFKSWLVQYNDRCLCLYLASQDSMQIVRVAGMLQSMHVRAKQIVTFSSVPSFLHAGILNPSVHTQCNSTITDH